MKKGVGLNKAHNREIKTEVDIHMYLVSKVELVIQKTIKNMQRLEFLVINFSAFFTYLTKIFP